MATVTRFAPSVSVGKTLHVGHVLNLVSIIKYARSQGGWWFYLIDYDWVFDNFRGEAPPDELFDIPRVLQEFAPAPMAHTLWRADRKQGGISHYDIVREIDKEMGTTVVIRGEDLREVREPPYAKALYVPIISTADQGYKLGLLGDPKICREFMNPNQELFERAKWFLAAVWYACRPIEPSKDYRPPIIWDPGDFARLFKIVEEGHNTIEHVKHQIKLELGYKS